MSSDNVVVSDAVRHSCSAISACLSTVARSPRIRRGAGRVQSGDRRTPASVRTPTQPTSTAPSQCACRIRCACLERSASRRPRTHSAAFCRSARSPCRRSRAARDPESGQIDQHRPRGRSGRDDRICALYGGLGDQDYRRDARRVDSFPAGRRVIRRSRARSRSASLQASCRGISR